MKTAIYAGRGYFDKSGTVMGALFDDELAPIMWPDVYKGVERGEEWLIRSATADEKAALDRALREITLGSMVAERKEERETPEPA